MLTRLACAVRAAFALLAVVVLTVGCGGDTDDGPSSPELSGRSFLLQSSEGYTPVEDTTIRIYFEDDQFGFNAGCNSHSGTYSLCDGKLCVENLSSTAIGCAAELHDQDNWLAAFVTSEPELVLDGDTLTLTGDDATLVFLDREVADPDRPLTGRTWTIDTLIEGSAASGGFSDIAPTVQFDEDETFEVFTSCNTGEGSYAVEGQELVLSDVAYTEIACPSDQAQMAEAHIQSVLIDGTVTWEIEAARLTLMRGDLGLSATTP